MVICLPDYGTALPSVLSFSDERRYFFACFYFVLRGDTMFNSKDALFGKRDDTAQKDNKMQGAIPRGLTTAGRTDAVMPPAAPVTEAPLIPATTATTASSGSKLIVGPDIKLKGVEITDCDTLVVEGRVEASMDSRVIQISEHGVYSGTVGIDVAEIHGRFEGELTARTQLIIHATGRVSGTIRYGKITVEDGGEISGNISTLSAAPAHGRADGGKDAPVDIMTPYDPFAHKGKPGAKTTAVPPH
jgi:cytoskeletal protein CcmA (bactofilin family)